MIKRLIILAQEFEKKIGPKGEYGGEGKFVLPPEHKAAMVLESGNFSCANCRFVDIENHSCNSTHYIEWNGGNKKLPDAPLDQICSDWFEPSSK